MITCCYTESIQQWSEEELGRKLALLPERFRARPLRYRQWIDRQLTISGKLMLLWLLRERGSELTLDDIKTTAFHRPYFENGPDFNIAHSGTMVICCLADAGRVGIDIELVKETDLTDFADYFTSTEWAQILRYPEKSDGFYDFWTRKEAVLKAIGTGLHTPLSAIDVSEDSFRYDLIDYHLRRLSVHTEYKCHFASTLAAPDVRLVRIDL